MSASPYRGFKPLNDRRLDLVYKKHGGGLSDDEGRELAMLDSCVEAMLDYRWPMKTFPELAELMDKLNAKRSE